MRPYTSVNMLDSRYLHWSTASGPSTQVQRKISDLGGNWTHDLRIWSPLLHPCSILNQIRDFSLYLGGGSWCCGPVKVPTIHHIHSSVRPHLISTIYMYLNCNARVSLFGHLFATLSFMLHAKQSSGDCQK